MSKQISRRKFLRGAAAAPLVVQSWNPMFGSAWGMGGDGADKGRVLFVGTQTQPGSKGIYSFGWDSATGSLKSLGVAAEVEFPTFLALSPDHKLLFCANEVDLFQGAKSGGVSSFHVQPGGRLAAINAEKTGGSGTCYVGVDATGRTLLAANYMGGSAASFKIAADGKISPAVSFFQFTGHGPNKDRQEAPHVHRSMVSPGGGFALFNDLGLDVIHIYKLDAATAVLSAHNPDAWHAPPGSGPRALRFHPNKKWAYCVLEMGASVVVLDWDESAGTLTSKQQIDMRPAGFSGRAQASDIVLDKSGRFAYAACRYFDCLVTFTVDPESGKLTFLARTSCGGKVPRDLSLDPSEKWLLVANQDSDGIAVFARDAESGRLAENGHSVALVKPQCLVFV